MRAGLGCGFQHSRPQPLARHLHQPEGRDTADLDAGAVGLEPILHPFLDGTVVTVVLHIYEIDHDKSREVSQAQLTRYFLRRFEVGLEGRLLDRGFLGRAS